MDTLLLMLEALIAGFLLYLLIKPDPAPVCGVYRLPGKWYWLKRIVFACMFHLRARKKKTGHGGSEAHNKKTDQSRGMGRSLSAAKMECCQPLPDHPDAMDSIYFGAYGQDGMNFALRIARRHERSAEIWFILEVPGVGVLQHPVHPDTALFNCDPNSYSAGGMWFEVVEPMKTWRIGFSGPLRVGLCNSIDNKPEKFLDVSFSFQWDAFAPVFNYDSDLDPSLLGDAIAREKWSKEYFDMLQRKHQTHYEQWGELKGTLTIEGQSTKQVCMKTIRDHSFGVRRWTDFYRYIYCFLYIENGTTVQVGAISQPGMLSNFKSGCVTYGSGDVAKVTQVDLNLWEVGESDCEPPTKWGFTFVADGVQYLLKLETKTSALLYHESDRGGIVHETFCQVELNGRKGWGLSEFFYRNKNRSEVPVETTLPLLSDPPLSDIAAEREKLWLPFTSRACGSAALVGGKGAQLAQLTSISSKEPVHVPPGLCVTLAAFEAQLKSNRSLSQAVNLVAETAVSDPTKLEAVCKEAVSLFTELAICTAVEEAVYEGLKQVFSGSIDSRRVAVRSSAAGEDGSEASAAGQMETYLGLRGVKQILEAVQKCWASAYTYQAVEYRRQHGQPIRTAVGVVIQEMVPAEAAGVMFTADPVTANSSVIVISANFGLGESVVSGRCEPDTITVRRGWDGSLKISEHKAGHKQTKITMTEDGGVKEETLSSPESSQCCVTDDVILSLAQLGVQIEKYYGSARDIEWAYADGKICLLQARPITTAEQETEEELIHEFDSPMASDDVVLTTGNISEMMPGAVTPLTISTFQLGVDQALQKWTQSVGARAQVTDYRKGLLASCNHLLISLTHMYLAPLQVAGSKKEMMELSLLGEARPDISIKSSEDSLGKPLPGSLRKIINGLKMWKTLFKAESQTRPWEKRLRTYKLGEGASTALELYLDIADHLNDYVDMWVKTLVNSAQSGSWSTILMSVLSGGSTDWTPDHYSDIALLLSQCQDVYSAEVPSAIQDLAKQIVEEGLSDTFLATSDEDCVGLLKSGSHPKLKQKTEVFLQRHGHRCVREAEMREKSWHLDPTKLIPVLKTILETKSYEWTSRPKQTAAQLVSQIKTPLPFLKRRLLQSVLPIAWNAVRVREWGKSLSIQMCDIFKCAYWRLAGMLVKEGRLPDEDLLFFLTHSEIGKLLASRSARLIVKAQRRRKVLSKQKSFHFPKICFGRPVPLDEKSKRDAHSGEAVDVLKGMPVSRGVVEGPARIVFSLAEAHTIQAGDILVVRCTDVGWTPYFPLIAGLVTELGGLVSHGAVVAREYGIPCIVNVPGATIKVPNGALIELNGGAGTVTILEEKNE